MSRLGIVLRRPCLPILTKHVRRMQSISARAEYKNSFHCAYRIFTEEGILAFWAGALPRLGRLMVSYRSDCSLAICICSLSRDIGQWRPCFHDVWENYGGVRQTRSRAKIHLKHFALIRRATRKKPSWNGVSPWPRLRAQGGLMRN